MRYAKWLRCFLAALFDRNVMTRVMAEVDLAWPRNFLLVIEEHLFPLGDPTGSARNREQDRKHGHRETHRLINEAGIEIHVGIEFAFDEVIVLEGDAFAFESNFEKRVFAHELENFIGDVLDDAGARIVIFVDAVAKSHQLELAGLDPFDEIGNLLNRANLQEHVQDFFIGAAVEWTVKRGDSSSGRGVGIDVRAADAANRVGGAVLLVVRMKNKQNVERTLQRRVRPVFWLGSAKEHVQKITRIAEVIVRIDERHTERMAIRERRDGRNFSDEAVGLLLA